MACNFEGANLYSSKSFQARLSHPFFTVRRCDAIRCTVFVIVILTVRLSVCMSVTLVHMVLPTITTAFTWCERRWPWWYFKVIKLFHIKFLKNSAWYGKNYYRPLKVNYTKLSIGATFDDLEVHLKVISALVVISTSIWAIPGMLSRRTVSQQ